MTSEPEALTSEIRKYRQCKLLNYDVSISYCDIDRRIDIFADNGRIVRPLLVVENGKLLAGTDHFDWDWDKLVASGIIRYVDNSEVENYHVAMTFAEICNTTEYCEIHPSMIMGIMGNMIPFPDHSPSPRNCYQSSMGKQALGIPTLSYRLRVDTLMHILNNIQKAVVTTQAAEIMGLSKMPSGINAIVAIMSYGGANQEDGLLLSKSSTERGLFLATTYRTFPCEEKRRDGNESEHIQLPDKEIRRRGFNYSYLDHRGVVRKGVLVKPTDILVGKVIIKIPKDGDREIEDASLRVTGDGGIVDDVIYEIAPNGYVLVKVTLRNIKWPERGDKFASRQAQKGTVGGIVPNADLPFTSDGITPDIIINPHAMPSRMTLNQLLECVLGKASCLTGTIGDATPFQESSHNAPKIVGDILMSMGYQRDGNETMYNGCTGEMLEGQVFIGPTYYQRLKHMVSDKMHSRAEGQVTAMTRQPREGRSRDGGLRFGEMERDCEIVQGASRFLKERLHDVSDPFKITVCDDCGHVSSSINECRVCGEDRMLVCNIPYATKLLINELQAMHMKTLITVTN
jgi:DNA-directed RNA polymerase II subunit RPB2